jgi:hypothetical protein
MKRGKLIQTVAYLTPSQKSGLEKLSKATRVSQQAYLREAVDDLLKKYRKAKK